MDVFSVKTLIWGAKQFLLVFALQFCLESPIRDQGPIGLGAVHTIIKLFNLQNRTVKQKVHSRLERKDIRAKQKSADREPWKIIQGQLVHRLI